VIFGQNILTQTTCTYTMLNLNCSLSQYLTNLTHKICFTISFTPCLYMFRALCAHHHGVKTALRSLWYHHTETSEWSKIGKIQLCKYGQILVKFMFEFLGCDWCVLLTVHMLCHLKVMFIQLLNWLERYYVYLHLSLLRLSSHKIV
jgi:hypothetical protein